MRVRVLFAMLPELGHMNPTYRIARTLKKRGHDVRYLAVLDVAQTVRAQGFEPVLHLEDVHPEGSLERVNTMSKLEVRKERTRVFDAMTETFAGERMRAVLRDAAPDVVLVDVCHSLMAFLARQLGLRTVQLSTSIPQTHDFGVPPPRSATMFEDRFAARARAELEWKQFVIKRKVAARAMSPLGLCPPYALALRAAPRFGVREDDTLEAYPMYMPQFLDTTELVLCPEAFDFPRPRAGRRHYVESFDRARKDGGEFPWARVDASKPLVYCSMSSQRYRPGQVATFFKVVVEVFRARPEWQLILSLGPHAAVEELAPIPANVLAVPRAPQLAILERARAMITHGGLGSVKEAIMAGVPMIVFPLDVDQPGNAARVAFHGIGVRGEVEKATRAELDGFLTKVIDSPDVRAAIDRMKARFLAVEEADFGADVIEAARA